MATAAATPAAVELLTHWEGQKVFFFTIRAVIDGKI